jgi:hypothetical protein
VDPRIDAAVSQAHPAPEARPPERRYRDGRDELNLADFPISVLQRQQPTDAQGAKLDTVAYAASRYDTRAGKRQQQRVILETSSRLGLPTPADENVILALLYVAKHSHNFAEPVVRFAPRQLFEIMGWAPNSRSYDRLREVLRRLKSLVIRYENSWWDIAGRAYEAEVATGIISEYELGRQVAGRKKGGAAPACWVCWTPHFQRSLSNGNLKKLDLQRLFALRLPTAQRMYRFLDKRFYPPQNPPAVEMDLVDFACGHVGLTRVDNVAELKRRLAPAIAELEAIGYIARADPRERYHKVRPGAWRIRFRAGPNFLPEPTAAPARTDPRPPVVSEPMPVPAKGDATAPERALVAAFYLRRDGAALSHAGDGDLRQARDLVQRYGEEAAQALVEPLADVVQRKWPECRSFSGAVQKYLGDAVRVWEQRERRGARQSQAQVRQQQDREEAERRRDEQHRLEARWEALPQPQRDAIAEGILQAHPEQRSRPGILRVLCLQELARLEGAGSEHRGQR